MGLVKEYVYPRYCFLGMVNAHLCVLTTELIVACVFLWDVGVHLALYIAIAHWCTPLTLALTPPHPHPCSLPVN